MNKEKMTDHYDNSWFDKYEKWLDNLADEEALMRMGFIDPEMFAMEYDV